MTATRRPGPCRSLWKTHDRRRRSYWGCRYGIVGVKPGGHESLGDKGRSWSRNRLRLSIYMRRCHRYNRRTKFLWNGGSYIFLNLGWGCPQSSSSAIGCLQFRWLSETQFIRSTKYPYPSAWQYPYILRFLFAALDCIPCTCHLM